MKRLLPLLLAPLALAETPVHPNEVRGEMSSAAYRDFEPGEVAKGGQVVLALLGDVDSFNPYLSDTIEADHVHGLLWPLPLKEHADYHQGPPTFGPGLVDRWEVSGTTVRMHLRDNATWSDGTPVTVDDVAFSLDAARNDDVAWPNSSIVGHIERLEAVDAKNYVLHFKLEYPDMLMDSKDWRIVPKHVFSKTPFKDWKSYGGWDEAAKVAFGPFKVERYKHNEEFVLVPNPTYWSPELPRLQRVIFRVVPSTQTQVDALLSGEIDAMEGLPAKDAKRILDHGDLRLFSFLSRSYIFAGWNCQHWIFTDPEVRRAMTHAIDRENIVEACYYGYAEIGTSPILSSFWAHDASIEPWPYDPDEALRILEGRGWTRGRDGVLEREGKRFEFWMSTNAGNKIREQILQLIQSNLKEIGVVMKPRPIDANAWSESAKNGKEDAFVYGMYVATKVDESPSFHSEGIGKFNYSRWSNPRVDELIESGRVEGVREKALATWHEFEAIFHKEQPYTVLLEPRSLNVLRKKFRNVEMNSLDIYDNLEEWFIPKSQQK
ncbi:MAG: ABC transporter substrate-binding protein [Planctomycetota bacterium]